MSPGPDDSVLGQDDIDSLVSVMAKKNEEAPTAPRAVQTPPVVEPPQAPEPPGAAVRAVSAGEQPVAGTADLVQRIEKLEAAVAKLTQAVGGSQSPSQVAALAKQVETLNARVQTLREYAAHSVGYRIHETFQCGACGQKGFVAGAVKCTACGQETWMGWWPPA